MSGEAKTKDPHEGTSARADDSALSRRNILLWTPPAGLRVN